MPEIDPDLCDCPCHTATGTAHAAPCCETCRICARRIKTGRYQAHLLAHLLSPVLMAEVRALIRGGDEARAIRTFRHGTGQGYETARVMVARLRTDMASAPAPAPTPAPEPASASEETPAMAEGSRPGMHAEHPQHAPLHRLPPEHGDPSGAHRCTAHEGMVAHTKGSRVTRSYAGGGAGDDDAGDHMSGRSA